MWRDSAVNDCYDFTSIVQRQEVLLRVKRVTLWAKSLKSWQLLNWLRNFSSLMEPEGSLLCSWRTCHWTLIPSSRMRSISLSMLIFTSHQRLCLSSGLFPSGFPTEVLYKVILSLAFYTPRPSYPWFDYFNIWWRVQIIKLLIMTFFKF